MSPDVSHRRQDDRGYHQPGHPLCTTDTVMAIVAAEQYLATEKKLKIFQSAYGNCGF
jgi:hypothetical protein